MLVLLCCIFGCLPVIAKNVAADIAVKLCDSVATKLEGKVLSTFSGKQAFFSEVIDNVRCSKFLFLP